VADAPGTEGGGPNAGPEAPKKKANRERAIVVGTVLLILLTYLILKRQSAAAASTAATANPSIDPNTGLPYGYGMSSGYIDPSTGLPYGYSAPSTTTAPAPDPNAVTGASGGSSPGGSTGGPTPTATSGGTGSPGPATGAPVMLAIPTNQPTGQYANATLQSGPYGAGGQTVAWPSWFGTGVAGATLASQFQANEAINAKTTPAQQAAVLQQASTDPALANYLKAVHAAGY
jgi:hypothetical protein